MSWSPGRMIPGLRYDDAPAAITWLCAAFGFEAALVVPGPDGTVAHAQLKLGDGMIMLGSAFDDPYGSKVKPPQDGVVTSAAYVVIADVDAHHDLAVAHGAEIVLPLVDQDYGGRGYTCRDCEGHIWSFGSYDPYA